MKTNKLSKHILDNLTTRDIVDCGQKIGKHGDIEYTIAYDTHNGTRRSIYHVDEYTYHVAVSKLRASILDYTVDYGVYVPSAGEYIVNYIQFIRTAPYTDNINRYRPIITNESDGKMNNSESGQGIIEYCVIGMLVIFCAAIILTFGMPIIQSVIDQLKALFVL